MGLLSIFNSKKTQDTAVDLIDDSVRGVGEWIDDMNFTDEEISKANQKMLDFRLEVLQKTADESSVRSISRRIIAWSVTYTFLIIIIISVLGFMSNAAWGEDVLNVAKILNPAFWTIISFYFVGHIGNGWIDKMKKSRSARSSD